MKQVIGNMPRFSILRIPVLVAWIFVWAVVVSQAQGAMTPAQVDLSEWQTPAKNQGKRGTCYVHSTLAAMEAAYKRAGYGDLALSREFVSYMNKMFKLETKKTNSPLGRETGLGSGRGGISYDLVRLLASGFRVPLETVMPYRPFAYEVDETSGRWSRQFNVSSFNLNPSNLSPDALIAKKYYSIKSYRTLEDSTNPKEFERVLAAGYEIIWDFRTSGKRGGPVWRYDGPAKPSDGGHSMLIIGYDRAKRVFLVKNSWNSKRLTKISYSYLKYAKGYKANYITAINPPKPWPELALVGRWQLKVGGTRGVLDVYHLPGLSQAFFQRHKIKDTTGKIMKDRRIGTFYANGDPGKAYRVNGKIQGRRMVFYLDRNRPNLDYHELRGNKYDFTLHKETNDIMNGSQRIAFGQPKTGVCRKLTANIAFRGGKMPIPLEKIGDLVSRSVIEQ